MSTQPAASTSIEHDYLMTLHTPVAGTPLQIDGSLTVYRGGEGWARGPAIDATIVAPTADWLRTMPGGSLRVDARMMLRTKDDAWIHVSYGGVIVVTQERFARMAKGEVLTADEMYFITTPVFQTSHPDYAWLNQVQAVGKVVAVKGGEGGYVTYDVFGVR